MDILFGAVVTCARAALYPRRTRGLFPLRRRASPAHSGATPPPRLPNAPPSARFASRLRRISARDARHCSFAGIDAPTGLVEGSRDQRFDAPSISFATKRGLAMSRRPTGLRPGAQEVAPEKRSRVGDLGIEKERSIITHKTLRGSWTKPPAPRRERSGSAEECRSRRK